MSAFVPGTRVREEADAAQEIGAACSKALLPGCIDEYSSDLLSSSSPIHFTVKRPIPMPSPSLLLVQIQFMYLYLVALDALERMAKLVRRVSGRWRVRPVSCVYA